jgi:hypothetical protein
MPHRNEQPTLFELTTCDEFEPPQGLALEPVPPSVIPKSDPSTPKRNVFPTEAGEFRAVSPWASMPLNEVCTACGREITDPGLRGAGRLL